MTPCVQCKTDIGCWFSETFCQKELYLANSKSWKIPGILIFF